MKNRAFERLLKQLEPLTLSQKEIVTSKLHQTNRLESVQQSLEDIKSCPHCNSNELHKWGYACKLTTIPL